MSIRLELRPEVEATLTDQARAKGLPLDEFLQNLIEELARTQGAPKPDVEKFRAALDRLAEMGKSLPHVRSSSFTREGIYQDHN